MTRKVEPVIPDEVKRIREKLEANPSGAALTRGERKREVSRDEAAYILSALAGRVIEPAYIKQLTRGKNPRLVPARPVGNTYLYTVESLLGVRFTRAHEEDAAKMDEKGEEDTVKVDEKGEEDAA